MLIIGASITAMIGVIALGMGALALAIVGALAIIVSTIVGGMLIIGASITAVAGVIALGMGALALAIVGAFAIIISTIAGGALIIATSFTAMAGVITLGAGTLTLAFAALTLAITGTMLAINGASKAIDNFGNTVASKFSNTMNSLVTSATDAFNKIANIFKKEIKMNIKLPVISVLGKFSGNPLQVPRFNLSWYKTGGIFTGPSVIGVGESGDEAVLPLSNKRRMKPFANAVASMMSLDTTSKASNNKGVTINIDNMSVRNDMDIKKIAEEINRLVARENRKLGII